MAASHQLIASLRAFAFAGGLAAITVAGLGQDAAPDPPTEAADPPAETTPDADPPATLDDLLGIDDEETGDGETADSAETAADAARREQEERLQRELAEQSIGDNFQQAIEKMLISADLLDKKFDAGLGTQRVQEDIIARLDYLLDQAKKQQQQSSSSSSSSSSSQSQSQSQQDPGKNQQSQQDGQQNQGGNERRDEPADSTEGDAPPGQEASINQIMEETRSEWGNLPEREREMLLQGRREKFSSLYQKLTEMYYQRLAEEGP